MNKVIGIAFLLLSFAFPALSQETGSFERVTFTTVPPPIVPFIEVEQEQMSQFRKDSSEMQPVFTDVETWKIFWNAYTGGRKPLPYADFSSQMILVSSRGEVSDINVDRKQGIIQVVTKDTDFSPEATPSFHIIKTEKLEFQSIIFEHPNPTKGLATGEERSDGTDSSATTTPDAESAASAPSCVHLRQWDEWRGWRGYRSWAQATNNCGYTVRLRMIWAWALDGSCTSLAPGWWRREWRTGGLPYVSELRSC
jgi:hypothetical protein